MKLHGNLYLLTLEECIISEFLINSYYSIMCVFILMMYNYSQEGCSHSFHYLTAIESFGLRLHQN